MTRLLTIGTFDTPHMGHATFLKKCERYADYVEVGVLSDDFVEGYKGKLPYYTQVERYVQIEQMGYVVWLVYNHLETIGKVMPDVIAVGSDWHGGLKYLNQLGVDQAYIDAYNIDIVYIAYTPGITTSDLKRRLT